MKFSDIEVNQEFNFKRFGLALRGYSGYFKKVPKGICGEVEYNAVDVLDESRHVQFKEDAEVDFP